MWFHCVCGANQWAQKFMQIEGKIDRPPEARWKERQVAMNWLTFLRAIPHDIYSGSMSFCNDRYLVLLWSDWSRHISWVWNNDGDNRHIDLYDSVVLGLAYIRTIISTVKNDISYLPITVLTHTWYFPFRTGAQWGLMFTLGGTKALIRTLFFSSVSSQQSQRSSNAL